LKRSVREYDTVARFGGDEFAVLIEASGLAQDYLAVAAKIIHVFESEPFAIENTQARVGVSIGISSCVSASGVTRERLMKQADFAMYEAKRTRQSTYRVFGEEVTEALRELQHA
jgi:diguanylate cyclase (GGDEF)-like protein